jgi:hypothetical protein
MLCHCILSTFDLRPPSVHVCFMNFCLEADLRALLRRVSGMVLASSLLPRDCLHLSASSLSFSPPAASPKVGIAIPVTFLWCPLSLPTSPSSALCFSWGRGFTCIVAFLVFLSFSPSVELAGFPPFHLCTTFPVIGKITSLFLSCESGDLIAFYEFGSLADFPFLFDLVRGGLPTAPIPRPWI